jgi:hypothetical protein
VSVTSAKRKGPKVDMPTNEQIDNRRLTEEMPYPYDEHIQSYLVKRQGDWLISVTPMIFNDRIVLTHAVDYPLGYSAGFCYDKGVGAFIAATLWDLETEHQPAGFKKVACDSRPQPQESKQ